MNKKCKQFFLIFTEPSPRDDFESLIYTIHFIAHGDMPWKIASGIAPGRIMQIKQEANADYFFKDFPCKHLIMNVFRIVPSALRVYQKPFTSR